MAKGGANKWLQISRVVEEITVGERREAAYESEE